MGHDRIEVIYRSYMDEKNSWLLRNGRVITDWEMYRKMRVDEDINNSKSVTRKSRYKASWRWSCFMENHHYNRRRENYESTDFETYYMLQAVALTEASACIYADAVDPHDPPVPLNTTLARAYF